MAVSILGGAFKGLTLSVPDNALTRPTAVLLRRKIFDRWQDCSGLNFIDLCSGSGPMGLEALSRGADSVVFVEKRREVVAMLQKNIALMVEKDKTHQVNARCVVENRDAVSWLAQFLTSGLATDSHMLFIDPPYEDHQLYQQLIDLLRQHSFPGHLLIESDRKKGPAQTFWDGLPWELKKSYQQGDHFINWYWPQTPSER